MVYSRSGDVWSYDLRSQRERKVRGAATRTYEESAPSIEFGRITFVRRGGRHNGLYLKDGKRLRRVTRARPRETFMNGSRVAYPSGHNVVIRRLSGRGKPARIKTPSQAFSLVLSRYSLTWAVRGGRVFQTPRFGGSSGIESVHTKHAANRRLPESLNSVANSGSFVRYFLDAEGVKRIEPKLFH
jgi:hypothetical protein